MRHPSFLRFVFHPRECCPATIFVFKAKCLGRQIRGEARECAGNKDKKRQKGDHARNQQQNGRRPMECSKDAQCDAGSILRVAGREGDRGLRGLAKRQPSFLQGIRTMHAQSPTRRGHAANTTSWASKCIATQKCREKRNLCKQLCPFELLFGLGSP